MFHINGFVIVDKTRDEISDVRFACEINADSDWCKVLRATWGILSGGYVITLRKSGKLLVGGHRSDDME